MKLFEMSDDLFWSLITRTTQYEAQPDQQVKALHDALATLSPDEIKGFELAFQRQQRRAYSWDLWGAAYLINGGASDDGFEYFQRWLISKGRKVFEAAIANPDSLGDMLTSDSRDLCEFEEYACVASTVWMEKTGIDPWKSATQVFPYTGAPPAAEPSGTPFQENSEYLSKRYPKLWARFGN